MAKPRDTHRGAHSAVKPRHPKAHLVSRPAQFSPGYSPADGPVEQGDAMGPPLLHGVLDDVGERGESPRTTTEVDEHLGNRPGVRLRGQFVEHRHDE